MNYQLSVSQRIFDNLKNLISSMRPGERLPSEPELAKQLGVSRPALREAMRIFEIRGLIQRKQGVGTHVIGPVPLIETGLEILESIEQIARRSGMEVTLGNLSVRYRSPLQEEVEVFGDTNKNVVEISRLILTQSRPVAYLIDILPQDVLKPDEINENFTGSVLDYLLKRGDLQLVSSYCEIQVVSAGDEISTNLSIFPNDMLLKFVAKLYSTSGRVVDYSFSYFIPEYFRFHVVRNVKQYNYD